VRYRPLSSPVVEGTLYHPPPEVPVTRTLLLTGTLTSLALLTSGCGKGTVSLGEDTGATGDCPSVVASTDTLTFDGAYLDAPTLRTLEIDNRCDGAGALQLGEAQAIGDGADFDVPPGPFEIQPGARLTLDIGYAAQDYEPRQAELRFPTNDPDVPELVITLRGSTSPDQDLDGVDAVEAGGTDCDDDDITVFPGAQELDDGVDQDCDGLVDEDFLRPGDIVIRELFVRPASQPALRQWVEVENSSDRAIDLVGFTLETAEASFAVGDTAVLQPGAVGVLARTEDGGLIGMDRPVLGVLEGSDRLDLIGGWSLVLRAGPDTVYELEGATFPRVQEGRSLQLDPTIRDPFQATRGDLWCQATSELETGEQATPGTDNDWCGQIDHDGDGTIYDRDCDDTDPRRSPDALEALDGVDNDCDGSVDRLSVPDDGAGYLSDMSYGLGSAISHGDYDGDGAVDMIVADNSTRQVRWFEADSLLGASDPWTTRQIGYERPSSPFIVDMAPEGADLDGDGRDDMVFATQGYTSETPFLAIATGGRLDRWDITVHASDFEARDRTSVALLDSDGDGAMEALSGLGDGDSRRGEAFLFSVDGLSDGEYDRYDLADRTWNGVSDFSGLGMFVAAGDLDDDGYDDMMIRTGERYRRNDARVWIVAGGSRIAPSGDIDDAADGWAEDASVADLNYRVHRPLLADLDDDGAMDLVAPGAEGTYVYLDASDRLSGGRDADLWFSSPSSGHQCGAAVGDFDADGSSELLLSWSDARFSASYQVSLFSTDTFSSGSGRVRFDDDDGRISSPGTGDLFGCSLHTADLSGGGADDIIALHPRRTNASGALDPRLWYFQSD